MKNISLKIILPISLCSILILILFLRASIINSEYMFEDAVEDKLLFAVEKYANEYSAIFREHEGVVNSLSASAASFFDTSEYENDEEKFKKLKTDYTKVVEDTLKNSTSVEGLYLTFNPATSMGRNEIWFLRDENNNIKSFDAVSVAKKWLVQKDPTTTYYYEALKNGEAWTGIYYDTQINIDMVSYSKAVYDHENRLIGVAGADIATSDIVAAVENMKIYYGSETFLFDKSFNYLCGSRDLSKDKTEYNQIKDKIENMNSSSGIIRYKNNDKEYNAVFSFMSNDWILVITQPENVVLSPLMHARNVMIVLAIMAVLSIILSTVYAVKKSLGTMLKEAEEKDLFLMSQSRQARLGEMIVNIAHQWKQPLNGMNITLSNMDYDFKHEELSTEAFEDYIKKMRFSIKSMSATADDFVDFLKPNREKECFVAEDEIKKALSLLEESIKVNSIHVDMIINNSPKIYAHRNEFCQSVFNVLDNARDAIIADKPDKRIIKITISEKETKANYNCAIIDIHNNGKAISKEVIGKMFNPYFSTKPSDKGTGIGLSLTKEIIEGHMGGSIFYINQTDGVTCRMIIPTAELLREE